MTAVRPWPNLPKVDRVGRVAVSPTTKRSGELISPRECFPPPTNIHKKQAAESAAWPVYKVGFCTVVQCLYLITVSVTVVVCVIPSPLAAMVSP